MPYAFASARFSGKGNRVGDDDFIELRFGDARHGAAREHRVRAIREHFLRAVFFQRRGRLAERIRRVDDVVHDHAGATFDVADDVHHLGDVRLGTALVDNREIGVEPLGDCARAHHPADIGRDNQQIVVVLLPEVTKQYGRRVDIVHRDVEEALDLIGMQVHRHHPIHAHRGEHVGDHLGGDRNTRRARPPILARVAEIGNGGSDPAGGRALQRVDHHQDLHQVIVGRRARRLQDEHVASAHVLEELDHHFTVGEPPDDTASEA